MVVVPVQGSALGVEDRAQGVIAEVINRIDQLDLAVVARHDAKQQFAGIVGVGVEFGAWEGA